MQGNGERSACGDDSTTSIFFTKSIVENLSNDRIVGQQQSNYKRHFENFCRIRYKTSIPACAILRFLMTQKSVSLFFFGGDILIN